MKVFLAFLLMFSVYADFSNICAGEDLSYSESVVVDHCQDSENDHSSTSRDKAHCHCELGHLHSACHTFAITYVTIGSSESTNLFPELMVSSPQNTHHEIIRPPIQA